MHLFNLCGSFLFFLCNTLTIEIITIKFACDDSIDLSNGVLLGHMEKRP